MKPYDFQEFDQTTLAAHNWTAPVSIEPGGGKTMLACLSGFRSGASVKLIIAPQGTHAEYFDTINALASSNGNADIRTLENRTKKGERAWSDLRWGVPGWYFITPQLFTRSEWAGIAPDLLVADECHNLLGWSTEGRKRLIGSGRIDPETGVRSGAIRAGMRLAMSGTIARNKFENWYAIARFVFPGRNGPGDIADASRIAWLESHMTSEYDHFAHNHKKYLTERSPGEFVNSLPVMIQHLRRETCCDFHPGGFLAHLPEPAVVRETVELLPEQKRAIAEVEDRYVTWLGENPMVVKIPITLQQRVRQLTLGVPVVSEDGEVDFADDAPSPKLDRAVEILEENDEPAVVFTSSRRFARVATLRFQAAGIAAAEYSGVVKDKDREDLRSDFKNGKVRVLVVVIAAGGTGLNLQTAALELWLDTDVDATIQRQAEARTDRMGQREQVTRYYLHDSNGVDEGIFGKNLAKALEMNASNRRRNG